MTPIKHIPRIPKWQEYAFRRGQGQQGGPPTSATGRVGRGSDLQIPADGGGSRVSAVRETEVRVHFNWPAPGQERGRDEGRQACFCTAVFAAGDVGVWRLRRASKLQAPAPRTGSGPLNPRQELNPTQLA